MPFVKNTNQTNFKLKSGMIVFLLLLSVYNAVSAGFSDFYYNHTQNHIKSWSENKKINTLIEYQSVKSAILSATRLQSRNSVYKEKLASVLVWGYYSGYETKAALRQALENFNDASALNPLRPWPLAEVVMTKWRLEEYDHDMLDAIKLLAIIGPNTPEANLTVVNAGLKLISKRPEFEQQLRSIIIEHYLSAEYDGRITGQMRQIKRDYNNPEWLPELVYWRDKVQK